MDLVKLLISFGLTKQESIIYLVLTQNEGLTGYEITKITGISRSNVYTSLNNLVDKGSSYIIEEKSKKYLALPINEFCDNKINKLINFKDKLVQNLPKKAQETTGYITITGDENIYNKIKQMIKKANKRIYFSISAEYIKLLNKDINEAIEKQIKVVIITDNEVFIDGIEVYYSSEKHNQIRIITDSENVLTGELSQMNSFEIFTSNNKNSSCLYSNKKNLVILFKESLQNEIKLIKLNNTANTINQRED